MNTDLEERDANNVARGQHTANALRRRELPEWFLDYSLRAVIVVSAGLAIGTLVVALWPGVPVTALLLGVSASLGLLTFGGIQVYTQRTQSQERRDAARVRLEGPAWLARRSCEQAIRDNEKADWFEWARGIGSREVLDRLEKQFLDVLKIAGEIGGTDAETGRSAFDSFLAAADRINALNSLETRSSGSGGYGVRAMMDAVDLQAEAVTHLRDAVNSLEVFAPRRDHEPALPPPDDSPQLELGG